MRNRSLVVVAIAATLTMSACKTADLPLTPDERARVEKLEADFEKAQKEAKTWENVARERLDAAKDAASRADEAEFDLAVIEMDSAVEEYEAALKESSTAAAEADAIYRAAQERGTSGFLGMIAPFIPAPVQPFVPFAAPLLGALFLDRPRKHLVAGAKGAAKLQLGETLQSLAKAAGWAHSTPTTKKIADEEMKAKPPSGAA